MQNTVVIDGTVDVILTQSAEGALQVIRDGETGIITKVKEADPYTGPTVVTPSGQTQTLATTGLLLPTDIVINPIPQNYGLITWNGSTLTVS